MAYFLLLAAYLIGSIPCGLILGRVLGVDVRKSGSGNIGATNVGRLLGKKPGLLTLAADALKGVAPMLLINLLIRDADAGEFLMILAGGSAFLGHLFPIYLGFKGGKGVATALGIFAYLEPQATIFVFFLFLLVVALSGFVSLGSLAGAAVMPCLVFILGGPDSHVLLAAFVGALIIVRHRSNIVRLLRHEEKSWKKGGDGNDRE